ncbi:mitochondrial import receptor subunit TOM22 homolog [Venturia canescens]|uniref:mitochondrial import receptor subunit TOM22 homolog n=1 Tax=Venturia canescens TaxID=32260 RepID=UPI001C9C7E7D|nr:mitochondrial import receptor subunit TOM22 homolog [Venturia canescens]
MASIEEVEVVEILDSGMGSSDVRSPEIKSILPDDGEDEEDESLAERLIGLTEMFPNEVRNFGYNFGSGLCRCIKGVYGLSCTVTWLFFSSSAILFAPVIFEIERSQLEEAQRAQQKQVLLGPSTAMSNVSAGMPMAPPVQR